MKKKEPISISGADLVVEKSLPLESGAALLVSVRLPQCAGSSRRARRINRYYRSMAQAYVRYCTMFLAPQVQHARGDVFARMSYRVTYCKGGLCSMYIDSAEGGAGGSRRVRRGDTWDLHSGYPLPLNAFFTKRSCKGQLVRLAREAVRQRLEAGEAEYYPDYRIRLRRWFNSDNFYLTERGICFFYPMLQIAPAIEGVPEFLVPYDGENPFEPAACGAE